MNKAKINSITKDSPYIGEINTFFYKNITLYLKKYFRKYIRNIASPYDVSLICVVCSYGNVSRERELVATTAPPSVRVQIFV